MCCFGSVMNLRRWLGLAKYVIAKYIRLSIEDEKTDSLSVENQRLMLDKHIKEMNFPDVEALEFVDNGHSGTNFERPAIQELLELVQMGRVNCIIVKDFSRFGRNMIENGHYIERVFPLYRVRFISISDGFDADDHDGGTGGLDVAFQFLVHEQYSRDLSQKIKSARRIKALRGESVTKNCAFGFKKVDSRLEIDEPAAETVRLIFEMYKNGYSLPEIAARLCKDKRPTPGEYKKRIPVPSCLWSASHISSRLHDEQYIGTYIAGKTMCVEVGSSKSVKVDATEWIRIPDHHPAIVDKAVFEAVREKIAQRTKPRHKRKLGAGKQFSPGEKVSRDETTCSFNGVPSCLRHLPAISAQLKQMKDAKRALYERFVHGEISADTFKSESAALDMELGGRIYS